LSVGDGVRGGAAAERLDAHGLAERKHALGMLPAVGTEDFPEFEGLARRRDPHGGRWHVLLGYVTWDEERSDGEPARVATSGATSTPGWLRARH
jgi:hypothetical protein